MSEEKNKNKEFLRLLAILCKDYNAGFRYTTADDGIHVQIDGKDIFTGFLDNDDMDKLLEASK